MVTWSYKKILLATTFYMYNSSDYVDKLSVEHCGKSISKKGGSSILVRKIVWGGQCVCLDQAKLFN